MIKIGIFICFILIVFFFFKSCKTGYVNHLGTWTWVTIDEGHGKRYHLIEGVDQASFTILENNRFAKDQYHVYFEGRKINGASPKGFVVLGDHKYGYAKDELHAFLHKEIIIDADPTSFEVLQFPYSKDKNDVYCGTIPMKLSVEALRSFKVTNEDTWMSGTMTTSNIRHFLEFNPEYDWIVSSHPDIHVVITGEYGTGEAGDIKFKGHKKIN